MHHRVAEFHLLGAYWALLPHEESKTSRRIDFHDPHGPDLSKGIELAQRVLAMYGLPNSDETLNRLREVGVVGESAQRLRQRCGFPG